MISVEELMKEPDDTPSAEEFDNLFIGLTEMSLYTFLEW